MGSSSSLKDQISHALQTTGGHPTNTPIPSTILSQLSGLSTSLRLSPAQLAEAWEAHSLTRGVERLDEVSWGGYKSALVKEAESRGVKTMTINNNDAFNGGDGNGGGGSGGVYGGRNVVVVPRSGLGKRTSPSSSVTPSPMAKRVGTPGAPNRETLGASGASGGGGGRSGISAVDNIHTAEGNAPASPAGKKGKEGNDATVITPPKSDVTPFKSPVAAGTALTVPSVPKTPKYQDRTDRDTTVTSYNPHDLPTALSVLQKRADEQTSSQASSPSNRTTAKCRISYHEKANHPQEGGASFRHMFTPLEKRARSLEERLVRMGERICERFGIKSDEEEGGEIGEIAENGGIGGIGDGVKKEEGDGGDVKSEGEMAPLTAVGIPKQNKVCCIGRVCNEAHEGKLNTTSILLEGSRYTSGGARIHLDLTSLHGTNNSTVNPTDSNIAPQNKPSYSLFPGQIIAVEGINSSGRTLQATRLIEGAPPPKETLPGSEWLDRQYGPKGQNGLPLSIVAMCGPYTTKDDLEYLPLMDAIFKISQDQPDVVILCGPFVDGRQPLIQNGRPTLDMEDGSQRIVSFEQLFADRISRSIEEMYEQDPEMKTQFVLVPSVDDAICDSVFPQPPLVDERVASRGNEESLGSLGLKYVELVGRENGSGRRSKRVHCVSNPATLRINDLTVGITSLDVLFHMCLSEINKNLEESRMDRLVQHLLNQRSYYPLFPPGKNAALDLGRMEEWEMPVQPDILIVPSKLNTFTKVVYGNGGSDGSTVVVNPGALARETTGGTYAVIDVHPMKREILEENVMKGDLEMESGVQGRVRVDIKKV